MAAIDLKQFHSTFFAESLSGLDAMEADLLRLERSGADKDTMNAIFRVVHSIKGASGTFGFSEIARFAHALETVLDDMRSARLAVTRELVNLLLEAGDGLRALLQAAEGGSVVDQAKLDALRAAVEALGKAGASAEPMPATAPANETGEMKRFHIRFRPHPHLFKSGNDPLRLFQLLDKLGELAVEADLPSLPAFAALAPEEAHLACNLTLTTAAPRAEIEDIFEWVTGDCELEITEDNRVPPGHLPEPTVARAQTEGREVSSRDAALTSLHVSTEKIDNLINLVGELVITETMLRRIGEDQDLARVPGMQAALAQLERNTRELQHSVMSIRMLPASFAFNRFLRMVRDVSLQLGKKVELKISGEQSELDKTVIEKLIDPLTHLVRNSLDHGIETPDLRRAAGKPETATLWLHAEHKGGNIVIQVRDDGQGLNRDKIRAKAIERGLLKAEEVLAPQELDQMIFLPGFSTADAVSDVSGRGVGMDVVWRNITSLGGSIEIESEAGKGTTFTIRLPLTLAIVDGMSVSLGREIYIMPLVFIIESIQPSTAMVKTIGAGARVVEVRDEYVPIVALHELFATGESRRLEDGILVLVEAEGRRVALLVDALVGQDQVVIKSLEANYRKVRYVSGATILGDGRVALILDINALVKAA